ncbi:sigma-70 family RNA polymerase sigma factor [Poriferisphaera sp. WC338]|uniref:sigma-70 family RNA polymerase sigma factor n=1 Tax=Poriferisphaera sp. WC338 TaxID=3425129 RepID=UPI003D81B994
MKEQKWGMSPQQPSFQDELRPHLPMLLRVASYLARNPHAAEDLVQETAMRAYKSYHTFDPGTRLHAWLLTILRRTHIDLYRRDRKHKKVFSLDAEEAWEEPVASEAGDFFMQGDSPQTIMERFADQVVIDALKAIPEAIRLTLLLVDVEQIDHADAAVILEVPVGTVKSRAHRGRAMLRQLLYEHAIKMNMIELSEIQDVRSASRKREVKS